MLNTVFCEIYFTQAGPQKNTPFLGGKLLTQLLKEHETIQVLFVFLIVILYLTISPANRHTGLNDLRTHFKKDKK